MFVPDTSHNDFSHGSATESHIAMSLAILFPAPSRFSIIVSMQLFNNAPIS